MMVYHFCNALNEKKKMDQLLLPFLLMKLLKVNKNAIFSVNIARQVPIFCLKNPLTFLRKVAKKIAGLSVITSWLNVMFVTSLYFFLS